MSNKAVYLQQSKLFALSCAYLPGEPLSVQLVMQSFILQNKENCSRLSEPAHSRSILCGRRVK